MNDGRYTMKVVAKNPEGNEEITFKLDCAYAYDPDTYGNGYHLSIKGDGFFPQYFDLRYDKEFRKSRKMAWLVDWAEFYWSGEDGAYKVTHIDIEEV